MNIKIKSQKGIVLKNLILIIGVIIAVLYIISVFKDFTTPRSNIGSVEKEESEYEAARLNSNLASLRKAIAESELKKLENPNYGYSIISQTVFSSIGQYAKKLDSKNEWFGNSNANFSGKMLDTSSQEITQLSDGNYTATFFMSKNKLVKYTFEIGSITNGAKIYISDK